MNNDKKKFKMPAWLGIVLMPVMIVFSGIALVTYVSTATLTIVGIQIAGVVMAVYSLIHRIHNRAVHKLIQQ